MGLASCQSVQEVKESFATVKSRGENLFKNAGIFIEKFYPESHHIEVQVFGNSLGDAIHFGERECSIQRRHQKVIEECPSPFVTKHPGRDLRSLYAESHSLTLSRSKRETRICSGTASRVYQVRLSRYDRVPSR